MAILRSHGQVYYYNVPGAGLWRCGEEQECRGRSLLPEREISSLLFLFSPPQAAKGKKATALVPEVRHID
jgi:hypothetical protein